MVRRHAFLPILLSLAFSLSAQEWSTDHHVAGIAGRCYAVTTWRGDLVAGGRAFQHDGRRLDGVVRFDGNTWHQVGPTSATGMGGLVRAFAEFNGDLIAAGELTAIGGTPVDGIARWDGQRWSPLGAGLASNSGLPTEVFALAVYRNELYAGGFFAQAGGSPIPGLARWDGAQWRPVGAGLSASTSYGPRVTALHAASDGRLYVGGSFDRAGTVVSPNLVAWDGSGYHAVGAGIAGSVSTFVFAITEFQGALHVGGNFGAVGGLTVNHVARWDGQRWHDLGQGLPDWTISTTVYALREYGGRLYAGGNFIEAGPRGLGVPASRVAAWDGQAWHGAGGIAGSDLKTTALAFGEWGGRLIVGGEFSLAGAGFAVGQPVVSTSIAGFDGSRWSQLGRGLGIDGLVRKIVPWRGGYVAVGDFVYAGRSLTTGAAWFDGVDWHALGHFGNGNVKDALVWNGDLYVTGTFRSIDGQPIQTTARYDGTRWHALGQGAGGWCLEVHGGRLIAGGTGGVRRWNGASWEQFMPEPGGHVNDMLSLGGLLYLGGSIPGPLGAPGNVFVWDGTSLNAVGGGTDRAVNELFDWRGRLLVGGEFKNAGPVAAGGAALWDGTRWQAIAPPITAGSVEAFAELDGALYAGGTFTHFLGFPAQGLARIDPVSGWQPVGGDVVGGVLDLRADPARGRLLVAGSFLRAGGGGLGHVARDLTVLDFRAPWNDLGGALAGRATPALVARGLPGGGRVSGFVLEGAPPRAPGVLVAGFGRNPVPFFGGTLVPPVALTAFFRADDYGAFGYELPIPAGILPSGLELTAQAWLLDPLGPQGATASNAVAGIVP